MGKRHVWLYAAIAIAAIALGVGYYTFEAPYRSFSAATARRIVAETGLERGASITVVSYELGERRSAPCSDPGTMAELVAWLGEATGKRQHEPGGPTPPEQWLVALDDGRQVTISWFDLAPTWRGEPRPAITGEVSSRGEQCLLRLPRAGFDRLREQMGVWWSWDEVEGVPPEVQAEAERGLRMYRSQVGPGAILPGSTGSEEEAAHITLERGFRLHYLDPDRLRNASGESLLELVYPAPAWLYAVNVDGVSKASLTVGLLNGEYQIVSGGGFTEDYGAALASFRRLVEAEGIAGLEPTLVEASPVHYYFAAQIGGREVVVPVASPERARLGWGGGMDYSRLWPAADVVRYLQELQRQGGAREQGDAATQ